MKDEQNQEAKDSLNSSLESTPPELQSDPDSNTSTVEEPTGSKAYKKLLKKTSIYLPLFIILIAAIGTITYIDYKHTHQPGPTIAQQTLSPSALSHLANANQVVGSSNQVLTVQSSSIFDGQVLIKNDLQVAGKLQIGGSLSLTGIIVSGNSVFDEMQINKNLSVGGNTSVQGTLAVQNDLSVSGNGAFSGTITAPQATFGSLQLNGDLNLTHHLAFTGSIPRGSSGGSLGGGGTSSVSGTDSSGTTTFSTGGGPSAGCYIAVNFTRPFTSQPHVLLTPIGFNSASLNYYVNRSSNSFSVCSINAPQGGQTYSFDYFITD